MNYRESTVCHHLRATWQTVAKMYNEEASHHGSTMATGFALLNIDLETGIQSTALGPQMGMEATSLSRLLKKMESKGFIYRERNPEDGRGVLIKLTELGKEKREVSKGSVLQFNKIVKDNITETQLQHFFEVSNKINQLISEKTIYNKK
ncbi:MarR family winged helix-turn-helix transcriptional regulator [Flavicella sediminum]|uniref:MarR family winged helix-turn-helix transcriptional regulator n=1 Tax=Flavicella sediminum TaxID=2585141 RepID=UPI00111E071D|nr:MarR family transcriptional regulator [Flavicella sediminum]